MSGTNRSQELSTYIKEVVDEHWRSRQEAILLAEFGTKVRREHPEYLDGVDDGLSKFIVRTAAAQIVGHPTLTKRVGLVPDGDPAPRKFGGRI